MVSFAIVDKWSDGFMRSAFKLEKVKTDNLVFRMHYKLSVWLVLAYSICFIYVALTNPIKCMTSNSKGLGEHLEALEDYCWVHGTYITDKIDPENQIYPGIGSLSEPGVNAHYHDFYKWMYFFMLFMIILLHLPRQLWRHIEDGRMGRLVGGLKGVILSYKDEAIILGRNNLVEYLRTHMGYHRQYAYGFVVAEFLNLAVSLTVMFIWDQIAGNELSAGGLGNFRNVFEGRVTTRTDKLAQIFPLLGQCAFNVYGPGGGIVINDILCILPLNYINERAAVFFWYYFMFVAIITACSLGFRLVVIGSRRVRIFLLSGLSPLIPLAELSTLNDHCSYADWFVLYQLGAAVEPLTFREVMQELLRKLEGGEPAGNQAVEV